MIVLTRHFEERWRQRVGTEPDPRVVQDILSDPGTVIVQKCRNLQVPATGELFRQAAIYWSPQLDLIIKLDEFRGRAITVLGKKNGGVS